MQKDTAHRGLVGDPTNATIAEQRRDINVLARTFERLERQHEQVICGAIAVRKINELHQVVQGIYAITLVVTASGVAEETDQPPLTPGLERGLLLAANSLAAFADASIDSLADWADARIEKAEGVANA